VSGILGEKQVGKRRYTKCEESKAETLLHGVHNDFSKTFGVRENV